MYIREPIVVQEDGDFFLSKKMNFIVFRFPSQYFDIMRIPMVFLVLI